MKKLIKDFFFKRQYPPIVAITAVIGTSLMYQGHLFIGLMSIIIVTIIFYCFSYN